MTTDQKPLPELLAPVGSPEALSAAIAAGADAVYFGGGAFNARMRAKNFAREDMAAAIRLCHAHGVKAYMTFNTLVTDKELPAFLEEATAAYKAGVDALIVADLGAAEMLHRALPDLPLHASTQCSAHSVDGVKALTRRGFCRVVPARELSRENIATLMEKGGTEIEIFIHGALCVSHSGQCLFSSLVGGRSGNRGACAQPCRLPDAGGKYPLSLKDLCLAREIPFFIRQGVHSLKIEGRLKSPDYVYKVVSVYRRLLDERRGATDKEMAALSAAFSRSGFTDGYFHDRVDSKMLGVRTEEDKQRSAPVDPQRLTPAPIPLSLFFTAKRDRPITLTLQTAAKTATVTGDMPLIAQNAPATPESAGKNLCRLGGTPFTVVKAEYDMDEGLMLPVSALNALRRAAVEALTAEAPRLSVGEMPPLPSPTGKRSVTATARFERADQITPAALRAFSIRYLPLFAFDDRANGVLLPPVIMDHERESVLDELKKAAQRGAKHALLGNIGHLPLAMEAGLLPHGDLRLNIQNGVALAAYLEAGFADALLSPELTLPRVRDIGGACDIVVYGRIPLMLLEKCVGHEVGNCAKCGKGQNQLTDRRGEKFPVFRIPAPAHIRHRNLLYNSRPTAMSDKQRDLRAAGITGGHYIFSTESPAEVDKVISAYKNAASLGDKVRRI